MREKKTIVELTNTTTEEYRGVKKLPVTLLCDNIRSTHNVGSFFRTSDALLVDGIILCGISPVPPHKEIAKTALGAEESVQWRYAEDAVKEVERLKNDGYRILVLEQTHDSTPLNLFRRQEGERYLLVVGNEVKGVDQRIVNLADTVLEIPQHGIKHSLNVSVSAAIALWQLLG